MTTTVIKSEEFIIRIGNEDLLNTLKGEEDLRLQLINPHNTGEYDSGRYEILKSILESVKI